MINVTREKYTALEIAKNNVTGYSFIYKNCTTQINQDENYQDIVDQNITNKYLNYQYIDTATTLRVNSEDGNDNVTGDGIQQVEIKGLNENWQSVTEVIELNGGNEIETVNQYMRVNSFKSYQVGLNGSSYGQIALRNPNTGFPLEYILRNENESMSCMYSVPLGFTAFINKIEIQSINNDKRAEIVIKVREKANLSNGFFQNIKRFTGLRLDINSTDNMIFVPEGSDIKVSARTKAGDDQINASYNLIVIDNNYINL